MLSRQVLSKCARLHNIRCMSSGGEGNYQYYLEKIGKREIVGFGYNGDPVYIDRCDYPMPAIRFKEATPDVQALRVKEKGDWKKLSVEEKKALYRASFCQTFAEMNAPTGEWKPCLGWSLFYCTLGLWMFVAYKQFIFPPLPESFSEENRLKQYESMLILNVNPITGISAHKWTDKK